MALQARKVQVWQPRLTLIFLEELRIATEAFNVRTPGRRDVAHRYRMPAGPQ